MDIERLVRVPGREDGRRDKCVESGTRNLIDRLVSSKKFYYLFRFSTLPFSGEGHH